MGWLALLLFDRSLFVEPLFDCADNGNKNNPEKTEEKENPYPAIKEIHEGQHQSKDA
jgi:hypothetical protein